MLLHLVSLLRCVIIIVYYYTLSLIPSRENKTYMSRSFHSH